MAETVATPAVPKGKKITLAGLALAAISPIALPFTEWAQSNPWLALPLVAVWEIVLLATAFALDVWAEIRPTLVGRAGEAAKFWIDCLLSGHRKRYLQDVIYQHRNFDVKGLSTQATFTLELEQVFVDLSVAPIAPHQASANMLRKLPPELREGRHQVWDFLEGVGSGAAKLVLIGAPGSGKTTLVKHIALTFAHGRSPRPKLKASRNLPILLFLREHAEAIIKNPDAKLSELVAGYQNEKRQLDIPASWFDDQLRRRRCLVMFDGLDEVADPKAREKVAAWADRQMSIHAGNAFIITSRPHGYRDNPLSGVNVLDVRPFTSEQVRDFVHRWYVANEIKSQQRNDAGVRQDARKGARDLLDRLYAAPALSDLAVNPLLLTMIATVHRYRSSLPGRRVELYAEICEVSLGKRQQSEGIQLDLTPAQKQRVLEPLAWEMMVGQKREIAKSDACAAIETTLRRVNQHIAPADFLVSVENDSSLLLEREAGGVYAFAHLTFQEYLAACHAQNEPRRIDRLTRSVGEGWWAECIRLFAATGDASPILRACISKHPLDPEALALALQCLEEAETKEPELEQELDRIVEVGLNEADPARYKPIAEALLKVRLARLQRLDEIRHIDTRPISNAEYQLFIDERREDQRPIHWDADRFAPGTGREPLLGLSSACAHRFCAWLTEREGGQWSFRLPTKVELDKSGVDQSSCAPWYISAGVEVPRVGVTTMPDDILAPPFDRIVQVALDRVSAPDPDLAEHLYHARDLAGALARYLPWDRATGDRSLDHALALDLAQALDRAIARALALAHGAPPLERDLVRDLARELPAGDVSSLLALTRSLDVVRFLHHGDVTDFGHSILAYLWTEDGLGFDHLSRLQRLRDRALALAILLRRGLPTASVSWLWRAFYWRRGSHDGHAGHRHYIYGVLDLHQLEQTAAAARRAFATADAALRLARDRIDGTDPPVEALVLVRERVGQDLAEEPGPSVQDRGGRALRSSGKAATGAA